MTQVFGMPVPEGHRGGHRPVARYLILIESGGSVVARLFLADRQPAGEFDASVQEVTLMIKGLTASAGALGREWDKALAGHSAAERGAAKVYTLDL